MKQSNVNEKEESLKQSFWQKNRLLFWISIFTGIVSSTLGLYISYVLKAIIDIVAGDETSFALRDIVMQCLIVCAIIGILGIINVKTQNRFKERAIRQYKDKVFERIIRKGVGAFRTENTAIYISGMTNDVGVIEEGYLNSSFNIVSQMGIRSYRRIPERTNSKEKAGRLMDSAGLLLVSVRCII